MPPQHLTRLTARAAAMALHRDLLDLAAKRISDRDERTATSDQRARHDEAAHVYRVVGYRLGAFIREYLR